MIKESILPPDLPLHAEPEHLIREESIREPGPYFGVLEAIASGYTTPTSIAGHLELKQQQITQFLDRLGELAYVTRVEPIEPRMKAAARGYWKISDPFFRFWFKYVFPNRSKLARGRLSDVAWMIKSDFATFVGPIFEDCCREWIGSHSDLGADATEVGSWWSRKNDVEIDVVTLSKNGYGLLGSCKWWTKQVGENVLDELIHAQTALGAKALQAKLVIFSRTGFTQSLEKRSANEGIELITVKDLFA